MGKALYYCYNADEASCEPLHRSYNYNSKSFSTSASSPQKNLKIKYEKRESLSYIIRCSNDCIEDERIYNTIICVDDCPSDVPILLYRK